MTFVLATETLLQLNLATQRADAFLTKWATTFAEEILWFRSIDDFAKSPDNKPRWLGSLVPRFPTTC